MENINNIIGKNLLNLRKEKKLTQMELAEIFKYSDKSISKWEAGDSMPNIEVLYELAKFYGVSLDYLVSETPEELPKEKKEIVKEKKPKRYPTKMVVTLLAVCAVWLIATTLFVTLTLFEISYPLCFLWAVPVSCIVLIVFNSVWGKSNYLFPILTVLLWSLLVCIHVQILIFDNIWPIYFLGIPLQVAITLWDALVRKPKNKSKKSETKSEITVENNN